MHPWHDVPIDGDLVGERFPAIIEVPRGSKNKYELDKSTGMLRLDRVLYSAVHYPADYGFVPRTLDGDGDPLDVLVLGQEPVHPLTLVTARAIGMFKMRDEKGIDDKVLAVNLGDPAWLHVRHHEELPRHVTDQVLRFFMDYKVLEQKDVVVERMLGPAEAVATIREALATYAATHPRPGGEGR